MMKDLYPYQLEGLDFLKGRRFALLADEMGLGKTAQVIRAIDALHLERVLVLCPGIARVNWYREFGRWSAQAWGFTLVFGVNKHTRLGEGASKNRVIICSYDLAHLVQGCNTQLLVLDESHLLKTLTTKRTRLVFAKNGLAHNAGRVWCVSGSPAPNHPGELWPMLYSFGVTHLPYESFVDRYCTHYPFNGKKVVTGVNYQHLHELKSALHSIMIRRKKEDVMPQLPPITYSDVLVPPADVDMAVHFPGFYFPRNHSRDLWDQIEEQRMLLELAFFTAKREAIKNYEREQVKMMAAMASSVATLRRYTGLQKVPAVVELVDQELKAKKYDKVVLFAIHKGVVEGLVKGLRSWGAVHVYGGTNPEHRQKQIDKFVTNPKTRVFIGNIQAAGVAIDLTVANQLVMVEQDWVPGNNAQAVMRCHRLNQIRPVFVRFIAVQDSIDEKISYILKRKTRDLTNLLESEPLFT